MVKNRDGMAGAAGGLVRNRDEVTRGGEGVAAPARNRDANGRAAGGLVRNRDQRKDGSGSISPAVPPMNRDIGRRIFLAT